jgi:hypothetical protein
MPDVTPTQKAHVHGSGNPLRSPKYGLRRSLLAAPCERLVVDETKRRRPRRRKSLTSNAHHTTHAQGEEGGRRSEVAIGLWAIRIIWVDALRC